MFGTMLHVPGTTSVRVAAGIAAAHGLLLPALRNLNMRGAYYLGPVKCGVIPTKGAM